MTARLRSGRLAGAACALACMTVLPAHAGNGLNVIGAGSESIGMGAADLATTSTPLALNINPSGLANVKAHAYEASGGIAYATDISHSDQLGNDVSVSNNIFGLMQIGYAQRFGSVVAGVGLFSQSGIGPIYQDVITPAGNRDELSSQFSVARFTPGLSWDATTNLSVGLSLDMNIARAKQRVLPNTSTATFSGYELQRASGVAPSAKAGFQYRASDSLTFAGNYSSQANLDLKHGKLIANFTAVGLGKVTYADAEVSGLSVPEQVGFGSALKLTPDLLLALDIDWLHWARALKSSTLRASGPDSSAAPQTIVSTTPLNWKNQFVFALGASYAVDPKLTVRAGYNYGKNPIPNETLTPLLAAIAEQTITSGFSYQMSELWKLSGALEWQLTKHVTYTNPNSPFGPNATESDGFVGIHITLLRTW